MTRTQSPLSLEYILLGFIFQAPIHGYDLYKKISSFDGIGLVWQIKQSQLYALLEKLEEIGLLTTNIVAGDAHLMRKEYQVTSIGKQSFLVWVTSPVSHARDMRQEFLSKLYFAQKSGSEVSLKLIEEQRAVCLQWISNLNTSYSKTTDEQPFEKIVFQYRISQTQAMVEWLNDRLQSGG